MTKKYSICPDRACRICAGPARTFPPAELRISAGNMEFLDSLPWLFIRFLHRCTGEFAPSSISTIFVELARFTKTDRSEFKGEYDILFYLLKHIHEMSEVPEDLKVGINRDLVEASEIAAFDGVKREQYEAKIMTELDYRYLDYYHSKKAREEGKAEGERIGEARGEAKGKAEGIQKVAGNMLSKGYDIQQICECTGLSEDEIRALKQNSNSGQS